MENQPRSREPKQYVLISFSEFDEARERLGWSTKGLYDRLGSSRSSWQRWQREGEVPFSFALPVMLAATLRNLGVSEAQLNAAFTELGLPPLDEPNQPFSRVKPKTE